MTTQWKTVHIFISSTFNDMHAERDYLVKQVFPQLREWCEKRKLRLVDIDLRWGVTEADARNQSVVRVCLDRIDDCRPFFLCFLGQRRGWIPSESDISPDTFSRFPALSQHAGNASVTELEILHALVDPLHRGRVRETGKTDEFYEPVKYAFFYLREDSYLPHLPDDPPQLRQTYTNESVEDDTERIKQNNQLEQWRSVKIPATGRPCRKYTARWDSSLDTPELLLPLKCPSTSEVARLNWENQWRMAGLNLASQDVEVDASQLPFARAFNNYLTRGRLADFQVESQPLSQVILADLQAAITDRYPDHPEVAGENDLQKELDQQEQFLFTGSEGFIERGGDFDDLDSYVHGESNQLFVLTAPGGMGKSSLLACWVNHYRQKTEGKSGDSIHFRFIGQSDRSTTIQSLLSFLLREIKEITGKLEQDITDDPRRLAQELPSLFEEIGKSGRTVIVLDALNQLETGLSNLSWLPTLLPKNIKLIVSLKQGEQVADELFSYWQGKVHLSEVKPFTTLEHRRQLVKRYLEQYLKQLDEKLLDALINLPGADNPLYLKIVLSELRIFGAFANLAEKIHSDFGETPLSAFTAVLRRLESDPAYAPLDPKISVPLLFGLLAHARQGLSVAELGRLFSQVQGVNESSALETIHLYLRQVRPFLAHRDGRYDFFFESFKLSARERYATEEHPAVEWHRHLAAYFNTLPTWETITGQVTPLPQIRKVSELAFHQARAEDWERLSLTLQDYDYLDAKLKALGLFDLLADFDSYQLQLPPPHAKSMLLIRDAIELSGHALEKDQNQLASQLIGRLAGLPFPELIALVRKAGKYDRSGWLCPRTKSLRSPGSSLKSKLEGHTDEINFLRALRAGERAVSGSRDGTVRVWDLKRGGTLGILHLEDSLRSAVMDVSGRRLAALNDSNTLVVWDVESFQELHRVSFPDTSVASYNISPNGRWLIYALDSGVVRIWDLETNKKARSLQLKDKTGNPDDDPVIALSIPNDGNCFARVHEGNRNRLGVYDLVENHSICQHTGSNFLLTPDGRSVIIALPLMGKVCLAPFSSELLWEELFEDNTKGDDLHLSADGRWLISPTNIYDLQNRELLGHFPVNDVDPRLVVVDEEGNQVFFSNGHEINRFDPRDKEAGCYPVGQKSITALDLLPQAGKVITATSDFSLQLWSIKEASQDRFIQLLGHEDDISAVQVTSDGMIISASHDHNIKFWNSQTGEEIHTGYQGHTDVVTRLVLSADHHFIASASFDRKVILWPLVKGLRPRELAGHADRIWALAINSDGSRVVSSGADATVIYWDIDHQRMTELKGHTGRVNGLVLTRDGRKAVSACADHTLRIWDLERKRELHCLQGHTGSVNQVLLTSDDLQVVSGSSDGTIKIWDLQKGQEILTLKAADFLPLSQLLLTRDGKRVVSGGRDGSIKVWDIKSGETLRKIETGGAVNAMSLLADDRRLVAASEGSHSMAVWDLETGLVVRTLTGHINDITTIQAGSEHDLVVSGSLDNTLIAWNLAQYYEISPADKDASLAILKDHPYAREQDLDLEAVDALLAGRQVLEFSDSSLWKQSTSGLTPGCDFPGITRDGDARRFCLTPDGWSLISAGYKKLVVWDLTSWKVVGELDCSSNSALVSPDGRSLITRDNEKICVRDFFSAVEKLTIQAGSEPNGSLKVLVTADGSSLIFATKDHAIKIVDFHTGIEKYTCRGHVKAVTDIAINKGGNRLYSVSEDGTTRTWNLNTGLQENLLREQPNPLVALAVSSDEHLLAVGSLWEIEVLDILAGRVISTLSNDGALGSLHLVQAGRQLLAASGNVVDVWDLVNNQKIGRLQAGEFQESAQIYAAVSSDERWLACDSGTSDRILFFDLLHLKPLPPLFEHISRVNALDISRDGRLLLSGAEDGTVKLWDISQRRLLSTLVGHSQPVTAAFFLRRQVVSASLDGTTRFWNLDTPSMRTSIYKQSSGVHLMVASPDRRFFACALQDGMLRVVDSVTYAIKHEWRVESIPGVLSFSTDGSHLWSGHDACVAIWNLQDGKQLAVHKFEDSDEYIGQVIKILPTPDGRSALFGSESGAIRHVNMESGDILQRWDETSDPIKALAFLPGEKQFLATCGEAGLYVGSLNVEELELVNMKAGEIPTALHVLNDPPRIAIGMQDGRLQLIKNLDDVNWKARIQGHPDDCSLVLLDRDRLVSRRETRIDVINLNTGHIESTFTDDGIIKSLSYLPGFNCLVCESDTGATHLLELRQVKGDAKTVPPFQEVLDFSPVTVPTQPEPPAPDANELEKMGKSCLDQGKFIEALDLFARALAVKPDDPNLLFYRATALTRAGMYEEAIALLDDVIARNLAPDLNLGYAYVGKANALTYLKRYQDSLEWYQKAIQVVDNVRSFWFMQGYTLYCLARYDQALESLHKAQSLSPEDQTAEYIGWSQLNLNKYEQAWETFTKLTGKAPRDILSWYGLGLAARALGKNEQAREYLLKFLGNAGPEHAPHISKVKEILQDLER